jgi:beta-galactosidase
MENIRHIQELKSNWRFIQEDCKHAEGIYFDDATWETVNVPHDWAIKGPFDEMHDIQITQIKEDGETKKHRHNGRTGGLPHAGKAWYRLKFTLPDSTEGKRFRIEFDGVMSHSKVYCNGKYVDSWPYGYASFAFDLTGFVNPGENQLAVSIDNKPHSSRWYPGAGIFRNVRLGTMNPIHIAHWGTYITTPEISEKNALVKIETKIENHITESTALVETQILKDGVAVTSAISEVKIAETATVNQEFKIPNPALWMPGAPNLYVAHSIVKVGGKTCDTYDTVFGIRSLEFDAKAGFKINGQPMRFKGVCMHHDLGPLGSAVNRTALKRQLIILHEMGCNAIRTSHNPPTPELLELCDRMGLLVIDEAFDEWRDHKCENGYNILFDKWAKKDLQALILRDRNHPSVIMWSIGNEIREQDHKHGVEVGKFLHEICNDEDPTRPTTAGFSNSEGAIEHGLADVVDIPGWNYKPFWYGRYHNEHSDWPMYGSETASCISSRGEYTFPVEEEKSPIHDNLQLSCYGLVSPPWGYSPEIEFRGLDENPSLMGEFVWTGFDYLGEPTPYSTQWPSRSSYFGIVDLCGIPKDRYYLYQSQWSDKKVLHLLPHWNWHGREEELTPVHCYTNYPQVELFVNGKSYGKRKKHQQLMLERYRLIWNTVCYEPGELKAVAYDKDDNAVAETIIRTAGPVAGIKLSANPDFSSEASDDMTFIHVQIVDSEGNLCPTASNLVKFKIDGPAEIAAVGNGNAATTDPFIADYRQAFHGQCMVYLRHAPNPGKITFTATSEGLQSSLEVNKKKS